MVLGFKEGMRVGFAASILLALAALVWSVHPGLTFLAASAVSAIGLAVYLTSSA